MTEHFGYILASYLVTIGIVVVLLAWILNDGRRQKQALLELEARGVKRRSQSDPGDG